MLDVRVSMFSSRLPWLRSQPPIHNVLSLVPRDGEACVYFEASLLLATSSLLRRLHASLPSSQCNVYSVMLPSVSSQVLELLKELLAVGVTLTSVTKDTLSEVQDVLDMLEIKASLFVSSHTATRQEDRDHSRKEDLHRSFLAPGQNDGGDAMNPSCRLSPSLRVPDFTVSSGGSDTENVPCIDEIRLPAKVYWVHDEILKQSPPTEIGDTDDETSLDRILNSKKKHNRIWMMKGFQKSSAKLDRKKVVGSFPYRGLPAVDAREGRMEDGSEDTGTCSQEGGAQSPGTDRSLLLKYVVRNMKSAGSGEDQFQCGVCGKTGGRKDSILNHVETIHFPGTFDYKCRVCTKSLPTKKSLDNHLFRNH